MAASTSQRSSVYYGVDKVVSITRSITKSRTFDHGSKRYSVKSLNKFTKWRQKSESGYGTDSNPIANKSFDNISAPDDTNKFVEFVKETWVTKYPAEPKVNYLRTINVEN